MTAIGCEAVTVRIDGSTIVDRAAVEVGAGGWVSVVGPNGAGKTTLLRAIVGLVPCAGVITIDGRRADTLRRRERARRVAYVPQSPVVPPGMSVAEYVLLGRVPHHGGLAAPGESDIGAARAALERLDLELLADRPVASLSGGERQRAFLARAITQDAPVLLLDEPTSALDIGHQQQVLDLVDELRHDRGLAVLSTMHDLSAAARYGDSLVMMSAGSVVASGSAAEVLVPGTIAEHYGADVRVLWDGDDVVVIPNRNAREP